MRLTPYHRGGSGTPLALQTATYEYVRSAAAHADAIAATVAGRRRATQLITEWFEHIPAELVAHLVLAAARCDGVDLLVNHALRAGRLLDTERIACPVRIVCGTADRLLPWPSAAARFRDLLRHADWVELDGVGHCPQLDVPLETVELVLGHTAPMRSFRPGRLSH